jgi:hypothetical protein
MKFKSKIKISKSKVKAPQLKEDLEGITIPFELFTGLSLVTKEIEDNGFTYSHFTNEYYAVLTFKSEDKEIDVTIEKETILIKQFGVNDGKRKLKVLYVMRPSDRKFNLIQKHNK